SFLNRAYPTMKKHNPYTPIMMREASGIEPRVFARYGTTTTPLGSHCSASIRSENVQLTKLTRRLSPPEFGKEKQEALSGLSDSQIEDRITTLVKQSS
ncbi:uncharacterized protein N7459_001653, partial [Penicillium hispanicum]|uniref:uncharacterized protein n=1 Tax=Penicillium hispanicum TaxID=1080232 RepID=UPI002541F17A